MRSGLTIGLDVGTSSAKAVVFDSEDGVLARGSHGYPTQTPEAGVAEQDPQGWWSASCQAVRAALADADVRPHDISALAVSGQGAALVLLGSRLEPMRSALIHLDQRASEQAARLAETPAGQAIARANGQRAGSWNAAAKLCWVREHEPHTYAATKGITSAAGYVLTRLTGELVQSQSDAGISDLFDLGSRQWSPEVLAELGIEPGLLPSVAPAIGVAGATTPEAARQLGLRPGTTVVAGGEDTSSAALAAGVIECEDTYLSLGSAGVVGVAVARGRIREPRLLTFPHVREEIDLLSGSMTSAGSALDWWSRVTGAEPAQLLSEAATTAKGAGGLVCLPYLAGELHPVNDPHARGVLAGLSLASERAQLTRSIIEGAAAAVAHNLEVAVGAGARPGTLYATGGPTRSALWMQAVADATGRTVQVVDEHGAALGDAILAAAETESEVAALAAAHRRVRASYAADAGEHEAAACRRRKAAALYETTRSWR